MTELASLLKRKSMTVMGVNTGTSIDGLDLSVVRIQQTSRMAKPRIRQLLHRTVSFSTEMQTELMQMASEPATSLDRVALLDEALGEFIGRACRALMTHGLKKGVKVDCISSHGQTVRHHPQVESIGGIPVRATLQIGSPERIATATNRIVVSHFRQANTAIGGEGAPITTEAVYYCLDSSQKSRLLVNIGGIANYFYLPYRKSSAFAIAKDIGPGNMLLDQLTQILFGQPYDKAGALAKKGSISDKLLKMLLQDSFFGNADSRKRQSTGREQFGADAVRRILKRAEKLEVTRYSVLATLTELTALKIYHALAPLLSADKHLSEIYLSGGGARNAFLVKRLQTLFGDGDSAWRVWPVSKIGIDPDSFEATCYATLGWMTLKGIPALSSKRASGSKKGSRVTGRKQLSPVSGRIIQPPHYGVK